MRRFFITALLLILTTPVFADNDLSKQAVAFYSDNNYQKTMDLILQIDENERTAQDWLILGNVLEDKGEKENAIFTGDTLFKNSIGRTDLPTGNERLVKNSLEKLKKLDQSIKVYPGHGDETTLKREFENNPYLK